MPQWATIGLREAEEYRQHIKAAEVEGARALIRWFVRFVVVALVALLMFATVLGAVVGSPDHKPRGCQHGQERCR